MPKFDITAIGEVMLRLSVASGEKLELAKKFDVTPGGTEANTLSALSCLERTCSFFTALPANPLGKIVENNLLLSKVNAENLIWKENGRIGTFYLEFASLPRATHVYYDRANSCMAELTHEEINWDNFLDTRLAHFSGITPALSTSCLEITKLAIKKAREKNIKISFDINYREKLWNTKKAKEVLSQLIEDIDLLFCSQADAERIFDLTGSGEDICKSLNKRFSIKNIVISMSDQGVTASDNQSIYHCAAKKVQIIDRIGAGDALAAGVIHGWLDNDLVRGLEYGTTLAAIALSQNGDTVHTSIQEIEAIISGNTTNLKR